MEGGHLVVGVEDKTLKIVGTDTYNYTTQQATLRLTNLCANLSSEGLDIEEFITEDTHKKVWVIHIPKHLPKLPVYAHNKAWQRIEDSLVELTPERLNAILEEQLFAPDDWSAGIVENATLADLDELAVAKARVMYKKVHSKIPANEIDGWSVEELLSNSGIIIDGKLTRAAIILLGKPTAVFKLRPAVVEVTWTLRDAKEDVVDYEHFNEKYTKILKENKTLTLQECIALDAVQKGHQISEETAKELLDKGLIEGESPNYQISLGVAKMTHQLPEYTRVSGLERSKLKQMTMQFIQNAGEDGTMRDGIYEYLKVAMPSNKTKEQNLRLLGNILKELKEEGAVSLKGLSWYEVKNPTKND